MHGVWKSIAKCCSVWMLFTKFSASSYSTVTKEIHALHKCILQEQEYGAAALLPLFWILHGQGYGPQFTRYAIDNAKRHQPRSVAVDLGSGRSVGHPPQKWGNAALVTHSVSVLPFTQGLLEICAESSESNRWILESTGLYGQSQIRILRMQRDRGDPEVVLSVSFSGHIFLEGADQVGSSRVLVLTWMENKLLDFDLDCGAHPYPSLALAAVFRYPLEGWGLAFSGSELLATSGNDKLYVFDIPIRPTSLPPPLPLSDGMVLSPARLEEVLVGSSQMQPKEEVLLTCPLEQPLHGVNEIEYVYDWKGGGRLLGNVFGRMTIVELDPRTGSCTTVWNFSGLEKGQQHDLNDVFNGIALMRDVKCTTDAKEVLVTGKRWTEMFYYVLP